MSNTGQYIKQQLCGWCLNPEQIAEINKYKSGCEYVNLINALSVVLDLDDRIAELENQVEFEMDEKGLARIARDEYAKRISELEKQNHFLREEITLYRQCIGGVAVLLNDNDATAARNYITEFNYDMDNRSLLSNAAE